MAQYEAIIYAGKMGSGKTTAAALDIIKNNKKGNPSWVNFPINDWKERNEDAPIYFCDDPNDVRFMKDGLFIYDEAYRGLNSRNWQTLDPTTHVAFTHIRKRHMNVRIIAQSYKRIDVTIRELCTHARIFDGTRLLNLNLPYTEYPIDEAGDIIKNPDALVDANDKGHFWLPKRGWGIFDTDFCFEEIGTKEWPSAIGYDPKTPPPSSLGKTTPNEPPHATTKGSR